MWDVTTHHALISNEVKMSVCINGCVYVHVITYPSPPHHGVSTNLPQMADDSYTFTCMFVYLWYKATIFLFHPIPVSHMWIQLCRYIIYPLHKHVFGCKISMKEISGVNFEFDWVDASLAMTLTQIRLTMCKRLSAYGCIMDRPQCQTIAPHSNTAGLLLQKEGCRSETTALIFPHNDNDVYKIMILEDVSIPGEWYWLCHAENHSLFPVICSALLQLISLACWY